MNQVEGDFANIYIHDSPVRDFSLVDGGITFTLDYAHIFKQHSHNKENRIIYTRDCQLSFLPILELEVKVYVDEEKKWDVIKVPNKNHLFQELLLSELSNSGNYLLGGMTASMQWTEWEIKASQVILQWEYERQ